MKSLKNNKDKIIGIIVSLVFIGLILWNLDVRQLLVTFKMFDYRVLLAFVPLYILSLYVRGVRWKYLLCSSKGLGVNEAFFAFTAGNALNSYLPARAGDIWRACHVGNKINESKMKLLGSVILERLMDGISVLLILFFAILAYFKHPWVLKIACVSAFLFIGALVFFYIIFKTDKISWFFDKLAGFSLFRPFEKSIRSLSSHLQSFMCGFESLNNPRCLMIAFFMSLLAWGIECLVTYILILGFGHHFGISIAFFVISFIALSTVIPSSSVFVGPYQYAYILALGIYHISKAQALGIAFIHQLTIMIVITVISVIYFLFAKSSLSEIKSESFRVSCSVDDIENKEGSNEQHPQG